MLRATIVFGFLMIPMVFAVLPAASIAGAPRVRITGVFSPSRFYRTELYFGRDKPDGSVVRDDEWKDFLDREVTPRFPAGFTVLDGTGQYRDKSGKIVKEPSKVLVFLYSKADRKPAGSKINEIRAAYCKQFQQESVLRLDFRKAVEVSFDE